MSGATVDIVVRSYYRDLEWLDYCLRSITRFAIGFRSVIVAIPRGSLGAFERRSLMPDRLVVCADYRDDYLGQQVTKLHADELTDADFIAHVDSDVVFTRATGPTDLMDGRRPQVLMTPYSIHPRSGPWRIPWQAVTERFVERPVLHNFMQMMPLTYPRWLYQELRDFAWKTHGCSLADYVLSQQARCFSEFNALGAFAHHFYPETMSWIDTSRDVLPAQRTRTFWSWGGITHDVRRQLDTIVSGGRT